MDLSLATTSSDQEQDRDVEISDNNSNSMNLLVPVEKEHMFDKVVTPSDVGKLNRLVIPKQHAEKYFPLDSSSSQNGTLLNFQDRNGKMWRFRYSYWNSSQSYVMTKGWSRFVKEKKLDAGDIVSFQRGVGSESARLRLFIDWRHRPDINLVQNPTLMPSSSSSSFLRHHHHHHNQFGNYNINFNFPTSVHGHRLPEYSVPRSLNFGVRGNPYHQQQHQYYRQQEREIIGYGGLVGRCWPLDQRNPSGSEPLVIDSVPVVPGRITPAVMAPPEMAAAAGKTLRLFGVNMECGGDHDHHSSSSSSGRDIILHESWVREGGLPRGEMGASSSSSPLRLSLSSDDDQYAKKGKSLSSLSLDLDP